MKNLLTWPLRILWFLLWFTGDLVRTNAKVIWDNVTPGQYSTPGISRIDTWCRTDVEVTFLAALLTLAPGTLPLGTSTRVDGLRVLFVHGMYCEDPDDLRHEMRDLERHLLSAIRREGFHRRGWPGEAPLLSEAKAQAEDRESPQPSAAPREKREILP